MASGSNRMEWQHGEPPPRHRNAYSPYDSPSPYDTQAPQGTPPYGGYHGGHGPAPPPQYPSSAMMPPRGGTSGGPPPPPDYWSYEQPPPQGPLRRGPPPPNGWRGPPLSLESSGVLYDHGMGPPPPHHQQGYPHFPPAPHRYPPHAPHPHGPPPHSMGPGRPRDGRHFLPDVQQPPPSTMRGSRDPSLRGGPPPVARTPPRSTIKRPAFGTPVRSSACIGIKTANEEKEPTARVTEAGGTKSNSKKAKGNGNGKKGDPLSLLAKVCKQESEDEPIPEAPATPAPVPTSPALRRLRPSPVVTPASTPLGKPPLMPHPQISPVDHRAEGGYWATEPNPEHYPRRTREGGPGPGSYPPSSSRQSTPYGSGGGPSLSASGPPPTPTQGSNYPEWQGESPSPALVERGSFDSVDNAPPTSEAHGPPPTQYGSRRGPPVGQYYGGGRHSDYPPSARGIPPPHMQRKYPPPRWSSYPPSDPGMRTPYPPQQNDMGGHPPPMNYSPHYNPNQSTPPPFGEAPPHPQAPSRPPYPSRHSQHSFPPHHHHHHHHPHGPPHHQYSNGPSTPMLRYDGQPPAPGGMHYAPYTYVQQPHLEEKTVLRKKFSWKHYPELERFLIANRDEYLKHSSMNYTAEQKQYNNWLTERLLEVAAEHHYAFDPEDFNFVAIRDRIRCYYKSYVQTARKRGLNLPTKADTSGASKKSKTRSSSNSDGDGDGEAAGEQCEDSGKDAAKDSSKSPPGDDDNDCKKS